MRKQRPQIRACSVCNQVGHNRSRCPQKAIQNRQPTPIASPRPMMNFFIHHVNHAAPRSPHVLDLKKSQSKTLENIRTADPDPQPNSYYHSYHELEEIKPNIFAAPQPLFQKSITEKNVKPKRNPFNFKRSAYHQPVVKYFHALISKIFALPRRAKSSAIRSAQNISSSFIKKIPWKRLVFTAASLMIILVAPFQANTYYRETKLAAGDISAFSTAGFMSLQESTAALMHGDVAAADKTIDTALNRFEAAIAIMQNQDHWLLTLISVVPILNDAVASRQKLLLAGQEISLGNAYLIKGANLSQSAASGALTERLQIISAHLKSAVPNYQDALNNLSQVKVETLPLEYQGPFNDFKTLFTGLTDDLDNLADLSDSLLEIFGGNGFRRYLLIFQNPAELRPTGGFMGSLAVLDVKDGQIVSLDIPPGGPYDLQGQLIENVEPPTPLLLLRSRWELQDANWFPDFPKSAEKILRFYRKSRAVTADGVIAINASVLERLLKIIGPIRDEKRDVILAADNALNTIQTIVESPEERVTQKPKQIIADLAPKFLSYFKNIDPQNLLAILANLQEALTQKEIQAYFTEQSTENQIKNFGWAGNILSTNDNQDYLMVVNSNIQGQKSDARIKQTISHQAVIETDGSITDTVIITRAHTGSAQEPLYGSHNIDYIRVYVPKGSELVEASGFTWPDESNFQTPLADARPDADLNAVEKEIAVDDKTGTRVTEEFGKIAFGNWIITEPGQTTQVQFVYRLPFNLQPQNESSPHWTDFILASKHDALSYQLVAQRQSGCESNIESQIIFPASYAPTWSQGSQINMAANGISVTNQPFEQDQIWSVLAQK